MESNEKYSGLDLTGDLLLAQSMKPVGTLAGMGLGRVALKNIRENSPQISKKWLEQFRQKYGKDIPAGYGVDPSPVPGQFFDPFKRKILLNSAHEASALHELGHAKNLAEGSKVSALTKFLIQKQKDAVTEANELKRIGKFSLWTAGRDLVEPIEEALAWKTGFKAAGKNSALKKAMFKSMLPTYGSYALKGLGTYGGLAYAGKSIYDYLSQE